MTTKYGQKYSNVAIPPGESLQEESEARGISARELSECCGMSVGGIQDIFRGAREITPEVAAKLEQALDGISATFWLNREARYQETLRRIGGSRPK